MYNFLHLTNMRTKSPVNRIKFWDLQHYESDPTFGLKNCKKHSAEKIPTNCYGEVNRYKQRLSVFMKKMKEGLYKLKIKIFKITQNFQKAFFFQKTP